MMNNDSNFMAEAIVEAKKGFAEGEVPIGAVAVREGAIVARGHNRRNALKDITAHAEIMCLRELSKDINNLDLSDVTIYSTLEPCAMCLGAMIHYNVKNIVFGEYDLLGGACGSKFEFNKTANVDVDDGVLRQECRSVLLDYFEIQLGEKSNRWKDIDLPAE
jgi:tRNA(adenine34) deaminase